MRPKFIKNSGKRNLDCQIQDKQLLQNSLQSLLLIIIQDRTLYVLGSIFILNHEAKGDIMFCKYLGKTHIFCTAIKKLSWTVKD